MPNDVLKTSIMIHVKLLPKYPDFSENAKRGRDEGRRDGLYKRYRHLGDALKRYVFGGERTAGQSMTDH